MDMDESIEEHEEDRKKATELMVKSGEAAYVIHRKDGMIFRQRKSESLASDPPISSTEALIIELCEYILKLENTKSSKSDLNDLYDLLSEEGVYSALHGVADWIENVWAKGPNAQLEDAKKIMLDRANNIRSIAHSMLR